MMRLAYPIYLLFLLVIPYLVWRYSRRRDSSTIRYSDIGRVKKVFALRNNRRPITHHIRHLLFLSRILVLTLFVLALARPQAELLTSEVYTEGVDIMLTLDVSGSMRLIDLDMQDKRTRMDVTKEAVSRFVDGRRNDRIGMLIFATDTFLQCPLTVDYGIIKNFLQDLHIGMIPENSTAIGNALASSLNRLRHTEAKSKVIILITDGANNAGQIDPLTAADLAQALGVKIYTIGVGGTGVPYMMQETIFGQRLVPYEQAERIDETSLQQIADRTGGQYFRASSVAGFRQVFNSIDELEKTKVISEGHRQFRELFPYFLLPALILLLIEVVLSQTRFRKLP